jgi:serine/threonine-protein kinase RsbW
MRKKVKIKSEIKNLIEVENLVEDLSGKLSLDKDIYGNVMIALIEGANNAILHGNKLDKDKNVEIEAIYEDDELRIVIADEGDGFDYLHLPDPTAPENINNPYGRGIFLMKRLSDEINFMDNGSKIEMCFKL